MAKKTTERGLGACLSAPDHRRISLAKVQAQVKRPKEFYFDDSEIPTEDQGQWGTCVGEAEGGEIECRELRDTGDVTPVSKLDLYGQCKLVDGFSGEGTYPTVAADIKVKYGAISKKLRPDNRSLNHAQIIEAARVAKNKDEVDDTSLRVASGYAFVQPILEDILQAIFQNGTYTATLQCGNWNDLPVKPTPSRGNHRIRLNGYRELEGGDALIWYRNSWGKNWARIPSSLKLNTQEKAKVKRGDGCFLFSEYQAFIYEQIVYTDIPYKMIMEARAQKYIFTRDLEYKKTGTDVMELQKRLAKEIALDGLPCFRYPSAQAQTFTTYYGVETRAAVQRYQLKYKIAKATDAGYGRFGPKTRAHVNSAVGVSAPLADVARKIVINAGHFDGDPGAVTLKEADEVKKIRDQAVIALKAAGFEVVPVPDDLDLKKSIAFANTAIKDLNGGLCIDIHLNANNDPKARGTEAYHGTSDTSKKIAEAMSRNVAKALKLSDRGAKPDTETHVGSLGWIRQTKGWATLVEVAFITNAADMAALRTAAGYKAAGKGIADAAVELFGASSPTPEPTKPTLADAKKKFQEGMDILNAL